VLRKEAADRSQSPARLQALYRKSVLSMAALSIVPLGILGLFGRPLFTLVFGRQWADAGTMAQILSPGLVLEFVALPLGIFFLVTGKQRYSFLVQLVALPAVLLAIGLGRYWLNDVLAMCALLAVAMFGANLAIIVLAGRAARQPALVEPQASIS
jgi:O-antigen/teichoic acid export membrane protein